MQEIIDNYKTAGQLHHFHVLVGDIEALAGELLDFSRRNLVPKDKWNSSIFKYHFDRLLIDDARAIIARSQIKTEKGSKMVFCISFNGVTEEAQNAFLKVIEEPTKDTLFFFIVPRSSFLLPTVLSRAVLINSDSRKSKNILKELLDKNIGERIKWADDIAKKISDEKLPKSYAKEVVESLIVELEKDLTKDKSKAVPLKKLQKINDYLSDSAASVKILLEKAALSI